MDITPADMARWPTETRVLWDMAIERGSVKVWSKKARDRFMRKACGAVPQFPQLSEHQWVGDHHAVRQSNALEFFVEEDTELAEDFDLRQRFVPASLPVMRMNFPHGSIEVRTSSLLSGSNSFFIDGQLVTSPQEFERMRQILSSRLGRARIVMPP